ncbi:hypothetical protein [Cellulomonas sp. URHB0016]
MSDGAGELFGMPATRLPTGRIRHGLDHDIAAAREGGTTLQGAGVAALRSMADQLDLMERGLRTNPKPYDRIPLAQLQRQFDDTYDRVFAAVAAAADPFLAALEAFGAAEARDTTHTGSPD